LSEGTKFPYKEFSTGKGCNELLTHFYTRNTPSTNSQRNYGKPDMNDLTRGERLQIMLTGEELEALDNWRFARRMPSRAAAIRELLKRGLAAEGFAAADGGSQSKDFGVTGKSLASGRDGVDTAE
jgi:hypothetical protein